MLRYFAKISSLVYISSRFIAILSSRTLRASEISVAALRSVSVPADCSTVSFANCWVIDEPPWRLPLVALLNNARAVP